MSYPQKRVLLVGATSGIGLAMAEKFIASGSKVVVVGRRQDRLDAFVAKHGSDKAGGIPFDVTNAAEIPHFVETVTSKYPDLDNVFLNPGIERRFDLSKPEAVDRKAFHDSLDLNFTSMVNLALGFLPFLQSRKHETAITFTGTLLSIVPAITLSAYSASKAALNVFIMCLRAELQNADSPVRVFELFTPPVQTELHDATMGPEKGRTFGMPADQFADQAYQGLVSGTEQVIIGSIGEPETFRGVVDTRMALFNELSARMRSLH